MGAVAADEPAGLDVVSVAVRVKHGAGNALAGIDKTGQFAAPLDLGARDFR